MNLATDHAALVELSATTELIYVVALVLSGVLLLVFGGIGFGQSVGMRVLNAVIGLAFLGYAFWIFFMSKPGDTIRIIFYVFIVPIALVVQAFRNRRATS
jgi:hypothetical protein